MNFIDELRWRGMVHDVMPGTEELFAKERVTAYVGIDPTADSLHIGHLVSVMAMMHLQRCGHQPVLLLGGATGMIGDPSGKSQERNLLDENTLRHHEGGIRRQLEKLLDFAPGKALLVNNYDWMRQWSFLDFIRDVGKHITVNYMMAKDSVKKRFSGEGDGMSFTEFTYQLVQGYDFLHLYKEYGCKLQVGGSDQWGNITTGSEMIRRMAGGEAFALTWPLIKKADGTKFGKTESGNIWLDARYTSPYKFYQFWLNVSDEDARSYIKIFTLLDRATIEELEREHDAAPHERALQRTLAREITTMIHSAADYQKAVEASSILFGGATAEALHGLDEATLLDIFDGVPQFKVSLVAASGAGSGSVSGSISSGAGAGSDSDSGVSFIELITERAAVLPSKGEARKLMAGGGVSLNKERIEADRPVTAADLIADKYLIVQKGKKNYYLLIVE